ncbi:hypothetical protein EGY07_11410 [Chryseobacterium indologenes]|jgi:hypothetical protein|uniref:hypothetical protein n=1 Tax=Chryseobacterium TaxID=59732 RepID=UPI000F50B08E|nr:MULTISPECIES: hypothetical protein [Chryseobacterium]AYZ36142.1 hypothetical protein EGY07_11410 [Chryseobacterium indologenes]MEB4760771.1 hypothetical protein [Chryseobacterium indologenes]RQO40132.1 hypothetical protein DBR39_04060 [Chryseobacterium sp. KBW03]
MEVLYDIRVRVSINSIEAGLLYKYLKMHPLEKRCITEGHFAYSFKDFQQKREFDLMLNLETIDCCVRALEDQDLNEPLENLLKQGLLEKIYQWADIIDREENAIEDFQSNYYAICLQKYGDEDTYFSFENYLKLRNITESHRIVNLEKPSRSILKWIRYFLNI